MTLKSVDSYDYAKPEGEWLRLSSDFTWLTNLLGERDDITVAITEGAGHGSPACYMFPTATVEIDADYWPVTCPPGKAQPADVRDWKNYPAIMGLLCHETAHANHSTWLYELGKQVLAGRRKLTDEQQHGMGSATLLEELRIEHLHLRHRSQDSPWLTAWAVTISVAEVLKSKKLSGVAHASRCALLMLGRLDVGNMVDDSNLQDVRQLIETTLGDSLLKQLTDIWREFLRCADDDTDEMLRLGVEWWKLTQDDPNDQQAGEFIDPDLADALDRLADELIQQVGDAGMREMLRKLADAIRKSDEEQEARDHAKRDAKKVFHGAAAAAPAGTYRSFTGWRTPTLDERGLARTTAQKILNAYLREKTLMPHMSVLPPGRLNSRSAMNREAQRAMGQYPTATPFRTVTRKANPSPPLDVGIIVDTSFSQDAAVKASASGAYSLAQATKIIPDGRVSLVTFGDMALKILGPYDKLPGAPVLEAGGGTGFFKEGVRAIDGEMNFLRKGAARLLVVVTDGVFVSGEFNGRDEMMRRLLDMGVHVLWVHTSQDRTSSTWRGQQIIPRYNHPNYRLAFMDDPADVPRLICDEAVKVLEVTK